DEATKFAAQAPLTYADLLADVPGKVGQPVVFSGEVLEARSQNHQTLALLDVLKACPKAPCLARIVLAGDDVTKRAEKGTVYGHVRGSIQAPGQTAGAPVPEITADFFIKGH